MSLQVIVLHWLPVRAGQARIYLRKQVNDIVGCDRMRRSCCAAHSGKGQTVAQGLSQGVQRFVASIVSALLASHCQCQYRTIDLSLGGKGVVEEYPQKDSKHGDVGSSTFEIATWSELAREKCSGDPNSSTPAPFLFAHVH